MAFLWLFILLLVLAGLGYLGYRIGGIRLALALLPLILAGFTVRWLGPLFFWMGLHRGLGLLGLIGVALLIGLVLGEVARFLIKRKYLSKEKDRHRLDRIAGVVLGAILATCSVWTGVTLHRTLITRQQQATGEFGGQRSGLDVLGSVLGSGVARVLPGAGSFAKDVNLLVELASAPPVAREQAVRDLELHKLRDLPELQAIQADDRTVADVEAAQRGSLVALFRLQQNRLVLDLVETDEMQRALQHVTLERLIERTRVHTQGAEQSP